MFDAFIRSLIYISNNNADTKFKLIPLAMMSSSISSTFSWALVNVLVPLNNDPEFCEKVSHYGSNSVNYDDLRILIFRFFSNNGYDSKSFRVHESFLTLVSEAISVLLNKMVCHHSNDFKTLLIIPHPRISKLLHTSNDHSCSPNLSYILRGGFHKTSR